jgi:tripartite-type tricarboxylate transporter receptor subunit TctC
MVVSEEVPVKTASELIAYAKANPGKLNLGSHGVGAFSHVAMELFMDAMGIQMQHIPYQGGGALLAGFRSGTVQVVLFDIVTVLPQVKAGKARVIAQVGEQRSPLFSHIPTVAETVAPGLTPDFWLGVMAPAGTPQAIVARLNREINEVMNAPEVRVKVEEASMLVPLRSPEVFAEKLHKEWETWGKLIRAKNIRAR